MPMFIGSTTLSVAAVATRVEGIAAHAENVQSGFCRQRLAGGDDAVARHDLRPALREPSFGAVATDRGAERFLSAILAAYGRGRYALRLGKDERSDE